MALTNKSIATFFFVATADGSNHRCDFCQAVIKQEPGKGYYNLLSHIIGMHSDYEIVMNNNAREVAARSTIPGNFLFISDKAEAYRRFLRKNGKSLPQVVKWKI